MSIKIHHGANGSYKTAGSIADDMIPAILAGRVIVTNVRGMSRQRCMENLENVPETFDLIHVDTTTSAGREKLATWFHWVPLGSYLFIDEVQSIWPKSWRDADIAKLAYPGGIEQATTDGRPKDWNDAFDMHRHFNWDICLTTPSIKKVRDDIRGTTEAAYKHKNQALLGSLFKGRYVEGFHLAEDNGGSASDFMAVTPKRIAKNSVVWKLYDSTQTGTIKDTTAGQNIFKNPKVLLLLVGLAGAVVFAGSRDTSALQRMAGGVEPVAPVDSVPVARPAVARSSSAPDGHRLFGAGVAVPSGEIFHPLGDLELYVAGVITGKRGPAVYLMAYTSKGDSFVLSQSDLVDSGYVVHRLADCLVTLEYNGVQFTIGCGAPSATAGERDRAPRPSPVSAG